MLAEQLALNIVSERHTTGETAISNLTDERLRQLAKQAADLFAAPDVPALEFGKCHMAFVIYPKIMEIFIQTVLRAAAYAAACKSAVAQSLQPSATAPSCIAKTPNGS